jgi:signal transduction histidine kinase
MVSLLYGPRGLPAFSAEGEVEVSIELSNMTAIVRVRDTGEGIAADRLSRILGLFVRGDRSQGLGIGLAVAKAIIEAHRGSITPRSAGPGTGSEFRSGCRVSRSPLAGNPSISRP